MRKLTWFIGGVLGLIVSVNAQAWVSAGHFHGGGYGGYNYNTGWVAHGVVIGVPEHAYYGYGCGVIQTCGPDRCVNRRVCE